MLTLSDVGIKHFYGQEVPSGSYQLKKEIEDFVVYEINSTETCSPGPIVPLEKYLASKEAYNSIPETAPKGERKAVYDRVRYYPFSKLSAKDDCFTTEETDHDIFLCTLMKYNLCSNDAIGILARRLKIPRQCVQFGGTKDKRGITFQEVSVNCSFSTLFNYAYSLSRNSEVGESRFVEEFGNFSDENARVVELLKEKMTVDENSQPIDDKMRICNIRKGFSKRMGDIIGNKFIIKITGLETVDKAPEYFLNYYGHQRFGIHFNNHLVGEAILNEKYDEALDMVLASEPALDQPKEDDQNGDDNNGQGENPNGSNTSAITEEANAEMKDPRMTGIKKNILRLKQKGFNSQSIIRNLNRLSRMMYMHAYQSYDFNCKLNSRREDGCAQPGDLVRQDGRFVPAEDGARLEDIYIPLLVENDKFLRGSQRKMIERIQDFSFERADGGVVVAFSLTKACYATCALRELIGDSVYTCRAD